MSDNIAITAGSGTTLATEDEGGVHYQKVKLTASGSGTTEALSKAEDAAHTSGDHGIMALAVQKTSGAALAGTDGDYTPLQTDASGNLRVAISADDVGSTVDTDDGSIAAAQASIALTLGLGYTYNGVAWIRGGVTPYQLISAATTNATNVKAAAGIVTSIAVTNSNAAARHIKLFDKATAPTPGTDVAVQTYLLKAGETTVIPLPANGLKFTLGIGFCLTVEGTLAGVTAVSVSEHVVNLGYL